MRLTVIGRPWGADRARLRPMGPTHTHHTHPPGGAAHLPNARLIVALTREPRVVQARRSRRGSGPGRRVGATAYSADAELFAGHSMRSGAATDTADELPPHPISLAAGVKDINWILTYHRASIGDRRRVSWALGL